MTTTQWRAEPKKESEFSVDYAPKETALLQQIRTFFDNSQNLDELERVFEQQQQQVEAGSKKRKRCCSLEELEARCRKDAVQPVNVVRIHTRQEQDKFVYNMIGSYHNRLNEYQRRYLDPVKRRTKITVRFQNNAKKEYETTLCQLNFYRWIIESKLIGHEEEEKTVTVKNTKRLCTRAHVWFEDQMVRGPHISNQEWRPMRGPSLDPTAEMNQFLVCKATKPLSSFLFKRERVIKRLCAVTTIKN